MKKLIISLLLVVSLSATAQIKIYKPGGKVLEGPKVSYKTGKVVLMMKGGEGSTLHDVTQILRIESPLDGSKASMWKRFLAGDFKLVGGKRVKVYKKLTVFSVGVRESPLHTVILY